MLVGSARLIWRLIAVVLLAYASPAQAEQRLALVIANEAYVSPGLGRLPGTRADTARMQAALTTAGFTVRVVSNAQKAQMQRAVADFVRDLAKAGQDGVGFLYYTGHGIADAKRGANYLIPVEADITSAAELPLYALPMDDVLDAIEGAGAKAAFVVFDACRSTPTSLSRGGKGLLPSRGRTDTLVAFATAPGETAADDGLYSRVLADHLARAGANSTTLFAEVQAEVARSSGRRQVPQFLSGLVEPVQFVAGSGGLYQPNTPVRPAATTPATPSASTPIERGYLGIRVQDLSDDLADALGLAKRHGEFLQSVEPGRGAANSGLKAGDVIVRVGDKDVTPEQTVSFLVGNTLPGTRIPIGFVRNGQRLTVEAIVGKRPSEEQLAQEERSKTGSGSPDTAKPVGTAIRDILGFATIPLTGEIARQLGANEETKGVVITAVDTSSDAASKGLKRGDIVLSANYRPMATAADLEAVVRQAKAEKHDAMLLKILRSGHAEVYLPIRIR